MKFYRSIFAMTGLAFLLAGCSDSTMDDSQGPRILSEDEITFLVPTPSVQKEDGADEDHLIPLTPNESTYYTAGLLTFWSPAQAVTDSVDVLATWLGDDDVEPYYGYDFDPEGLQFERPVMLRIALDQVEGFEDLDAFALGQMGDFIDQLLLLYDMEDGNYEVVPSVVLREMQQDGTIRLWMQGTITHFSKYIVGGGPPGGGGGGE